MPSMTGAYYCVMTNRTYERLAEYVFVNGGTATDSNTYYVWAMNNNVTTTTKDWDGNGTYETGYTYTGLYVGATQTAISSINNASSTITAGNYYKVTVLNGVATFTLVTTYIDNRTVQYVDATTETIKLGGYNTAHAYTGATVKVYDVSGVVLVETSIADIAAGDQVTVLLDVYNSVTTIYKTKDSGVVVVNGNSDIANPWTGVTISAGGTTAASYQEGAVINVTVEATGGSWTSGANHYMSTNVGTYTAVGTGTTALTFSIPVTDAVLAAGVVTINSVYGD